MLENLNNVVYDTNYTALIPNGGYVFVKENITATPLPTPTPAAPEPSQKK
jgi:hypothetical protein